MSDREKENYHSEEQFSLTSTETPYANSTPSGHVPSEKITSSNEKESAEYKERDAVESKWSEYTNKNDELDKTHSPTSESVNAVVPVHEEEVFWESNTKIGKEETDLTQTDIMDGSTPEAKHSSDYEVSRTYIFSNTISDKLDITQHPEPKEEVERTLAEREDKTTSMAGDCAQLLERPAGVGGTLMKGDPEVISILEVTQHSEKEVKLERNLMNHETEITPPTDLARDFDSDVGRGKLLVIDSIERSPTTEVAKYTESVVSKGRIFGKDGCIVTPTTEVANYFEDGVEEKKALMKDGTETSSATEVAECSENMVKPEIKSVKDESEVNPTTEMVAQHLEIEGGLERAPVKGEPEMSPGSVDTVHNGVGIEGTTVTNETQMIHTGVEVPQHSGNVTEVERMLEKDESTCAVEVIRNSSEEQQANTETQMCTSEQTVTKGLSEEAAGATKHISISCEAAGSSGSQSQAAPKKGTMQLERLSHEDLLKLCKKQLLFLQKTKMKNDDLSRNLLEIQNENKVLKEMSSKPGVPAELLRRLQSENDRLLDEKESQAEVVVQLQKDMARLVTDLTTYKEQMEENKEKCNQMKDSLAAAEAEKKRQDAFILELQSQIIVLRSERDSDLKKTEELHSEIKQWMRKFHSQEDELKRKGQEATNLQNSLDQLKQELEQGKVLSLEIVDYERSLSDLNEQLAQSNQRVEELDMNLQKKQQEQEDLHHQIGLLEQQCLSEEGRSAHLKETLESTRQQLAEKCQETSNLSSSLDEMKQQKEDILASKEELQYQLSVSSSQLTLLQTELKQSREQSEKLDISLKNRISTLTDELTDARQQLEASQKVFDSYKVRVHSVLKQQKTTVQPVSVLSVLDDDQKGQMEWTLELCRGKISQMTEQLDALTLEKESLQKEQEWLISKQNLLTQQMQEKEEALVRRLDESKQELELCHSLWESEKQQMQHQKQNLIHEYEQRLSSLESEYEKQVNSLVSQVDQLQRNSSYHTPISVELNMPKQSQQNQTFDMLPSSPLSPSVDESFDICSQERQEGEGSECTDTLPAPAAFQTLVTSPASGFMTLERLLQADPSQHLCHQDPELLAINMNTLQKKVDHISELLNESEASNLRLTEQTRLLKEEIRRLERNSERQEHFANLEYLKNIVVKFITLPNGSERGRLVPVLSTLLRLSPEEQAQMAEVSSQEPPDGSSGTGGWGSYLHRWSGLV